MHDITPSCGVNQRKKQREQALAKESRERQGALREKAAKERLGGLIRRIKQGEVCLRVCSVFAALLVGFLAFIFVPDVSSMARIVVKAIRSTITAFGAPLESKDT